MLYGTLLNGQQIPEQPADEEDCSPVVLPKDTLEPHSVKLKMGSSLKYWCSSIERKLYFIE
jgi:hypothetical protein